MKWLLQVQMNTSIITYDSIFDYSEFISDDFNQGENMITDCTLIIGDKRYRSHTIILASSSIFFYNAFTSGMHEDVEREVKIYYNPKNVFLDVLRWFYTGKIQITPDNIMCIFAVSRFYGIKLLEKSIEDILNTDITTPDLLVLLINQCYESELNSELKYLIKFISNFYFTNKISTMQLSEILDIPTFCQVL